MIAYDLYDYCFSYTLKAKFHYASWFEPDSVMEFGRGPASSCYFAASKLDDRPDFSSLEVCDQLRTSFGPDSVMEFGFQWAEVHRIAGTCGGDIAV